MNIQGLYTPSYEHDSCGVGMVVNIHGAKTHQLVDTSGAGPSAFLVPSKAQDHAK